MRIHLPVTAGMLHLLPVCVLAAVVWRRAWATKLDALLLLVAIGARLEARGSRLEARGARLEEPTLLYLPMLAAGVVLASCWDEIATILDRTIRRRWARIVFTAAALLPAPRNGRSPDLASRAHDAT